MKLKSFLFKNRSSKQTIIKNAFWLAMAEFLSKSAMFLLNIWIARYLGAEGFGVLSFSIAFVSIFSMLPDFGLNILAVREVARDRKNVRKFVENILTIKSFLSLITLLIIVVVIQFVGKSSNAKMLVYVAALNLIFTSYVTFFNSLFRAYERMELEALAHTFHSLIMTVLVYCVISTALGVVSISLTYLISSLLTLALICLIVSKYVTKFLMAKDRSFLRSILKEAWPFALSSTFVSIYFWVDTVMLYMMKTDQVVGWYNAAYRIVFSLSLFPSLFMFSIFPRLSRAFNNSRANFVLGYKLSLKYMVLLATPMFAILFILSKPIIMALYGSEYSNSIAAFQILLWAEFFAYFSHIFLFTLSAANKQRVYTFIVGIGLIINLILNLVLIPKHSYIGASIATVATEFAAFISLFIYTRFFIKRLVLNDG